VRRKFEQWWTSQLTPQANPIAHKILPFINSQSAAEMDFTAPNLHNMHANRESSIIDNHHATHPSMIVHPALQTVHTQYPNQKTRMRTSFDPEMELPKLQRWFAENPHPSRQQIQTYVVQLNSLESRRGRKPLDVNNVVYWFKNARAAQKRAETRGSHNLSNGYTTPSGLLMSHADYMKSSPSAPSDDIDNISQHSDCDMDDDERPLSPQLPLQLTVHERNRSMNSPVNIECEPRIKLEDERSCSSPVGNNNEKEKNNSGSNGNDEADQSFNRTNSSSNNNNNDDSVKSNNSIDHSSNSPQPRSPSPSEDLDIDDPDISQIDGYRSPSPDSKRDLPFPIVNPNSMFSAHSIMYMSHYIPAMQNAHQQVHGQNHPALNAAGLNLSNSFNSSDERRKRNRTFIDPVTEVPKLEQWFSMNTHPSHNLILKYTEDLNRMPYR